MKIAKGISVKNNNICTLQQIQPWGRQWGRKIVNYVDFYFDNYDQVKHIVDKMTETHILPTTKTVQKTVSFDNEIVKKIERDERFGVGSFSYRVNKIIEIVAAYKTEIK